MNSISGEDCSARRPVLITGRFVFVVSERFAQKQAASRSEAGAKFRRERHARSGTVWERVHARLLQHNDQTHPAHYSRLQERLPVGNSGSTLLDILSSEQFQIVILLKLGLNTLQIADLLEANEWTVSSSLSESLDRTKRGRTDCQADF